jgi:hypothetical protein
MTICPFQHQKGLVVSLRMIAGELIDGGEDLLN